MTITSFDWFGVKTGDKLPENGVPLSPNYSASPRVRSSWYALGEPKLTEKGIGHSKQKRVRAAYGLIFKIDGDAA